MAKKKEIDIHKEVRKLRNDLEPLYARLEQIKRDLYETFEQSHKNV